MSNDNPFSESLFKTYKYDLDHPKVFSDYAQAKAWTAAFFVRYNGEHRHSGLAGSPRAASTTAAGWSRRRSGRRCWMPAIRHALDAIGGRQW